MHNHLSHGIFSNPHFLFIKSCTLTLICLKLFCVQVPVKLSVITAYLYDDLVPRLPPPTEKQTNKQTQKNNNKTGKTQKIGMFPYSGHHTSTLKAYIVCHSVRWKIQLFMLFFSFCCESSHSISIFLSSISKT